MARSVTPIAGLQSTIWDNNFRSMLLLALYPIILCGVIFAAATLLGHMASGSVDQMAGNSGAWERSAHNAMALLSRYWPTILTVVVIWFTIAYFFQGSMIRALSKSHGVTRIDEPELYNLVENLCISRGMKLPRIEIIETHARNAFASGINDSTYCITVTRGLMQSLSTDELEAVLAHELAHIINRDVRLMMVCVIFTGMFGIAAQLIWSNLRYSLYLPRSSDRRGGGVSGGLFVLLALMAILWVGYLASLLARFAISRNREYMADAGAVQLTKNPDAMMRALLRISGAADIPKAPADIKALCFENRQAFLGLFATHPPIASRVQMIADYSGLSIPQITPKERANDNDVFARPEQPRDNWLTRERFKSRRIKNPWH